MIIYVGHRLYYYVMSAHMPLNIKAKALYAGIQQHAVTRPRIKNLQGDEAVEAV